MHLICRRALFRTHLTRALSNLDKKDDVKSFVIKREITRKSGKTYTKAPKIQRYVNLERLDADLVAASSLPCACRGSVT